MTVIETAGPARGIGQLFELLRGEGFPVSTSEAVDATQLLLILAEKEPEVLEDPARLRARLRPVFCKTREHQERFDTIFGRWHQPAKPVGPPPPPPPPPPPEKPRWLLWIAFGLAALAALAPIAIRLREHAPMANPPVTETRPPAPVSPPAPELLAGSPPPRGAVIYGYFPRLRYNDELRPVWLWVLAALPLAALGGFSIPALIIARTRSRRRRDPMYLDRRALEEEARRIVPPLRPEIAGKLARHLRGSPEGEFRLTRRPILDIRSTIEQTLRNRGIPSPQYRHTHAPPTYLLLIDVANQKDPRGRLFYQWAERLQRERLDVEITLVRLHDGQPQFARTARGKLPRDERAWTSLARLPEPPFGQRLLLVSSGEPLAEADGRWHAEASAARLHRWRQRAMFTPTEPRDWGPREDAIERSEHTADPGFLVLPLDENALSAWTDLLTTGQLSDVVLSEPQRFPSLLRRGKAKDFLDDQNAPKDLEKLIGQLRVYLGDLGFTWLAALAIPPLVRWELTVLLGRDVVQRLTPLERRDIDAVLSRNYRRLVRLPWLRFERMPDWLRLRLLAELPVATQNELRAVVEKLLGDLSPSPPGGEGIALEFERPPGEKAPTSGRDDADDSDPLYLGYMSGLTPRQLAMRAPESWGRWLGKLQLPRERGLRGFFASSADWARAWWARRVFLRGVPFSGLRRGPIAWAAIVVLLGAAFLTLVANKERSWWPDALEPWLFEEQAHAIAFHHAAAVRSAVFSADGQRVVTASDDGTARVWDVRTGRAVTPPLRHGEAVIAARFSPDGTLVLTASGDTARLWDVRTGAPRRSWPISPAPIRQVEFNRSGSRILVVSGAVARVFDVAGERAITLAARVEQINHAAFSHEDLVVTANADRTVRVWTSAGALMQTLRHDDVVLHAAFSPDGRYVATGSLNGRVDVWAIWTGVLAATTTTSGGEPILRTQFGPDGKMILTAGFDGTARFWRWAGMESPPLVLEHAAAVVSTSYSADGQRIVTASIDGTARVWNATTGRPTGPRLRHQLALTSAVFSPDGTRIVTSSLDGTARIWEAVADPPEMPPLRHKDLVIAVAFDAAGKRVVTASWDGSAKVWDATNGTQLIPELRHTDQLWSAAFSPDGRSVVTASADKVAAIWDSQTGQPLTRKLQHEDKVFYATFSHDGRRVLTASADQTARIWDARTGSPVGLPMRHSKGIWHAFFAPDDRHVMTASYDNTARIWDTVTSKPAGKPLQHVDAVRRGAYSPDGRRVATASADDTARVWHARSGAALTPPLRHDGDVIDIAFDPEGQRVVTASQDMTARIWDISRGRLLHKLQHNGGVERVAFSPDGTSVVTGSDDRTARIWNSQTGELLGPPLWHGDPIVRVAFSPDGRRIITGSGLPVEGINFPNEYVAPRNSAQIWRARPYQTPEASQANGIRRRVDRVLENFSLDGIIFAIAAATLAAILAAALIAMVRRRRQLDRLVTTRMQERTA